MYTCILPFVYKYLYINTLYTHTCIHVILPFVYKY